MILDIAVASVFLRQQQCCGMGERNVAQELGGVGLTCRLSTMVEANLGDMERGFV